MRRGALAFAFAGVLLTSGLAAAAIGPQPTHMLSPTNPVSFCDGSVMPGDPSCVPGAITYDGAGHAALDFGGATCNGASSFTVNTQNVPVDGGTNAQGRKVAITQYDNSDPSHPRPIAFAFTEPTLKSAGSMTLLDPNGDHVYTQMHFVGNLDSSPIDITLDIEPFDLDHDGVPDFVSTSDLTPMQFFGMSCTVPGNPNPVDVSTIFVPVAHQPDGNSAIIMDTNGDNVPDPDAYFGPLLAAAAAVGPTQIPTVSGLGLAILALLLLAAGLRLARRSSRQVAG